MSNIIFQSKVSTEKRINNESPKKRKKPLRSSPRADILGGGGRRLPQGTGHMIVSIIVLGSFETSLTIEEQSLKVQRRDLLLHTVFGALSVPAMVPFAYAEEEGFQIYSDDVNKFKITIPQDWQIGGGEGNDFKSVTAFYPSEASNSNVSVVITGLGADFTKLESFGKVDGFAENLVSGLDRSWQKPPGVSAKLIDSKATKGMYYIEYILQNPGESARHLISVLGIANNEADA
ncbi:unnamed protein product [Lactuca virosa]|uniref:PsbP C-terminal domain-containing protein n=1 Tax=Lactuca virosa TaxID=75947 RepID=A0AAU9NS88_9ASTR|nr:unnamed protein product [Lactuca virosa]